MLAGRKDKLKWSQDPQNCHWSRDKSKFGYRMLEQMGWKEGKGLGSKEDGGVRHIQIPKKQDNRGVGSKRSRDAEWIEHQDAFNKILAGLNAAQSKDGSLNAAQSKDGSPCSQEKRQAVGSPRQEQEGSGKTLVENAMEAKKIVYKRFLRSKDLSAQSVEDLDCVFGRQKHKKSEPVLRPPEKDETPSHGITTVTNSQSVNDYFAEKLKAKRRKVDETLTDTNEDTQKGPRTKKANKKERTLKKARTSSQKDASIGSHQGDVQKGRTTKK